MTTCPHQAEGPGLLAAGALEPAEEARMREHLGSCAACRREFEAHQALLSLATLPPPSAREQAVLATLPSRAVGAWHRAQVQRAARLRTTGGLMVAAAVALLALGPVLQRRHAPTLVPSTAAQEPAEPSSEESVALQQWALADPLADALDSTDLEGSEGGNDSLDLESEDLLFNSDLGDAP